MLKTGFKGVQWHLYKIGIRRSQHTESAFSSRQVTLSVDHPDKVTIRQVVNVLPRFQQISRRPGDFGKPHLKTLFILGTPSFATWLEANSEFIPNALQQVFGNLSADPVKVDVVCAVVDGLAPRPSLMQPSGEGFSIHYLSQHSLGELWAETKRSPAQTSPNMQSTLTFTSDRPGKFAVTLPLANTLFKNQRLSTLLLSRWRSSGDSFVISRQQIEKDNVNINVFGCLGGGFPHINIPMVPLTPVRRIESGLGNIVRRLDFADGDVGPASRELEMNVTQYLAQHRNERSTIDVWALVIPRDAFLRGEIESKEVSMVTVDDVREKWASPSLTPDCSYVGNWIDKGATLCRVVSGGGGWGQKQGLLSLDPQTTYSTINESRFDFSEGSLDDQQASALGKIAQQGAFIQFLIADENKNPADSLEESQPEYIGYTRTSTVLGAVPSTVDEIHGIEDKKLDKELLKANVQGYLGHFGCVSESGIFLQRCLVRSKNGQKAAEGEARLAQTKIDLPYSYIYQDLAKSKRQLSGVKESAE